MAIIKYRVSMPECRVDKNQDSEIGSSYVYELVTNPNKKGKQLTKERAMEMVKEQGLVVVHKNKYGVIWDRPDEPMLQKYEGKFKPQME